MLNYLQPLPNSRKINNVSEIIATFHQGLLQNVTHHFRILQNLIVNCDDHIHYSDSKKLVHDLMLIINDDIQLLRKLLNEENKLETSDNNIIINRKLLKDRHTTITVLCVCASIFLTNNSQPILIIPICANKSASASICLGGRAARHYVVSIIRCRTGASS